MEDFTGGSAKGVDEKPLAGTFTFTGETVWDSAGEHTVEFTFTPENSTDPADPKEPTDTTIPDDTANEPGGSQDTDKAPMTGDTINIASGTILLLLSLSGMAAALLSQKKIKPFNPSNRHIK